MPQMFDPARFRPLFSESQGGITRFSFVNEEPVDGRRLLFTFDSVVREVRTVASDVTSYAVPLYGSFSDTINKLPDRFDVDVMIAASIDDVPDLVNVQEAWAQYGDGAELVRVPAAGNWNIRSRDMARKLDQIRGIPLVVSFARHDTFPNLVLTGFSDRRGTAMGASFTLSFQQIRRAVSETVIVPVIPRLEQQAPPTQVDDTQLNDASIQLNADESIAFAQSQMGGVGAGPDRPIRQRNTDLDVRHHATDFGNSTRIVNLTQTQSL